MNSFFLNNYFFFINYFFYSIDTLNIWNYAYILVILMRCIIIIIFSLLSLKIISFSFLSSTLDNIFLHLLKGSIIFVEKSLSFSSCSLISILQLLSLIYFEIIFSQLSGAFGTLKYPSWVYSSFIF